MTDDPGALAGGFTGGELGSEPGEDARCVGVGEIPVVVDVGDVPEVSVDRDDAEAFFGGMGVGAVVEGGVVGFG